MNWTKVSDKFPPYGEKVIVACLTSFIPIDIGMPTPDKKFYTYDIGKWCCDIKWVMQCYTPENCLKLKVAPIPEYWMPFEKINKD